MARDSKTKRYAEQIEQEAVTDHGSLGGLGDDDHGQYVLANGTRNINYSSGSFSIGDVSGGNNLSISSDGSPSFSGTSRIDWSKTAAASITVSAGTAVGTVSDLQTHGDGNFLSITEAAATPGSDLIVDFTSVNAFNWVQVIAVYDGSTSHANALQLYNWTNTRWDTFDGLQDGMFDVSSADGYIAEDHSFFVPSDTDFIGTGGDAGKVRVRFYHTMAGNASHDLYVDVVALYQ